jgi:hypothetical protein
MPKLRLDKLMTFSIFLRVIVLCAMTSMAFGAQRAKELSKLHDEEMAQLRAFASQKEQQAEGLAGKANEQIGSPYREFFDAAKKGQSQTVTNIYEDIKRRHHQYNASGDLPHTSYWQCVLEIALAYFEVAWGEPDHVNLALDGFSKSIPAGCIYFGGTDPGRGLPTAFSKDHTKGDPFFSLTQNALADGSYLEYLRRMYGEKVYIASPEDSAGAFSNYIADVSIRVRTGNLKPGEDVKMVDGKVTVSGQIAVMEINGRLAKIIFDKNPEREFYLEESFPLDWMYPHLTPAGHVMKLEREPIEHISEASVKADTDYWNERVQKLLNAKIRIDGSRADFARQVESIYVKRSSKVDPRYVKDEWAQKAFSKWRSSISGIYLWRAKQEKDPAERQRMAKAAESASRQAYLLCPYSPEAVHRYVTFLNENGRREDAMSIVQTTLKIVPNDQTFQGLKASFEETNSRQTSPRR